MTILIAFPPLYHISQIDSALFSRGDKYAINESIGFQGCSAKVFAMTFCQSRAVNDKPCAFSDIVTEKVIIGTLGIVPLAPMTGFSKWENNILSDWPEVSNQRFRSAL